MSDESNLELTSELNRLVREAVGSDLSLSRLARLLEDYLGLDELNTRYFLSLYRKKISADRKWVLRIYEPHRERVDGTRTVYPTAIAPVRYLQALRQVKYEDLYRSSARYEERSRNVAFWVKKMQAGSGSSMTRTSYMSRIRGLPESEVRIGAKGTDLLISAAGLSEENGWIPLAEAQILQSILEFRRGEVGALFFHDIVSSETEEAIHGIWRKECVLDSSRTYEQYVSAHPGMGRFGMTHQQLIPTLDEKGELSLNRMAPGGHALFALDALRAAYRAEARPSAPGMTLIAAISNGEDLSSAPDPLMLGYMAEEKVPVALVTTERMPVDAKGGLISLLEDESGELSLTVLETAQAKEAGQISLFERLGGMVNTNLALFNYEVLTPLLTREVEEIGDEAFLKVIAPDLISNVKEQRDADGVSRKYLQLEGAMGSTLMNLDRHWRKRHGEPLVHLIHVGRERRTDFFSPIKSAFDFFLQFHSDRFELNPHAMRLRNRRPGNLPLVSLSDPLTQDRYYQDVGNVLESFEGTSVLDLDELRVEGQVRLANAVLRGRVRIINHVKAPKEPVDIGRLMPRPLGRPLVFENQSVEISDDPVLGLRCVCSDFGPLRAIA